MLHDAALTRLDVVANSRMNRERRAVGVNSYERELGFSPLDFLQARLDATGSASWLDLCCGEGRALMDAAMSFRDRMDRASLRLMGVDLIAAFAPVPADAVLQFHVSPLHLWETANRFDLITCIHGLHYVGDKLAVVNRAAGWLSAQGLFAASLDLENLKREDGKPMTREILKCFRSRGFEFNRRRHLLTCTGQRTAPHGYQFVGAQVAGQPNYSGHEAIDSYYRKAD